MRLASNPVHLPVKLAGVHTQHPCYSVRNSALFRPVSRATGARDYESIFSSLTLQHTRRCVDPPSPNPSSQRASVCPTNGTSLSAEPSASIQQLVMARRRSYHPLWSR